MAIATGTRLPDRYSAIRKLLISLRASSPDLSDAHKATIQAALLNLHDIELAVEKGLDNPSSLKSAKFNAVLSEDLDGLTAALAELKAAKSGV